MNENGHIKIKEAIIDSIKENNRDRNIEGG